MFAFSPKRKAATVEKRDPSRARVATVAASNRNSSKRAREADAATGAGVPLRNEVTRNTAISCEQHPDEVLLHGLLALLEVGH